MKLLYSEWQHRISQYWSITIKVKTVCFALMFMPFLYENLKVDANNLPSFLFPVTGLVLSFISCLIETVEMNKINAIKKTIKANISKISPINKRFTRDSWIHHHIPLMIFGTQLMLTVAIVFILLT